MEPDWHARFNATHRAYRYVIINRRAGLTFDRGVALRVPVLLDASSMDRAAQALVGQHDFSTFRDTECQAKTPVKTLKKINVARYGDGLEVTVEARSFLHKQVRSMVGSLVEVGRGARGEDWIRQILEARKREECGPVAPPDGLFLERVEYGSLE